MRRLRADPQRRLRPVREGRPPVTTRVPVPAIQTLSLIIKNPPRAGSLRWRCGCVNEPRRRRVWSDGRDTPMTAQPQVQPEEVLDPVCGMTISPDDAVGTAVTPRPDLLLLRGILPRAVQGRSRTIPRSEAAGVGRRRAAAGRRLHMPDAPGGRPGSGPGPVRTAAWRSSRDRRRSRTRTATPNSTT